MGVAYKQKHLERMSVVYKLHCFKFLNVTATRQSLPWPLGYVSKTI